MEYLSDAEAGVVHDLLGEPLHLAGRRVLAQPGGEGGEGLKALHPCRWADLKTNKNLKHVQKIYIYIYIYVHTCI
jgi:hypothetical protein